MENLQIKNLCENKIGKSDPSTIEEKGPRYASWSANHQKTYKPIWHVDITPIPELPLYLCPMSIGRQSTDNSLYRADGLWRSEQDYCYFCYTLSGIGSFWDSKGVYYLSEGECFLTEIADPETGYFYPGIDKLPWHFLAFNFRGLAARAMVRELIGQYGHLYRLALNSSIICRLMSYEASPYSTIYPHALDGAELILELLVTLSSEVRAKETPHAMIELIRRALEIIDRELENTLTVAMLAESVGVNREYLSRAFQKLLHQTPQQLIREKKMRRASFLLKDTDLLIKQIASRLGYSDYTNFIRSFRLVTGLTPHDFRLHGSITLPPPFPQLNHLQDKLRF